MVEHTNNDVHISSNDDNNTDVTRIVNDPQELLRYGVCRAKLPSTWNHRIVQQWTERLSCIPPMAMTMEGDQEYPLYQNIMSDIDTNDDDDDNNNNSDQVDDDDGGLWKDLFAVLRKVDDDEDNVEEDTTMSSLPSIPQALERYFLHETIELNASSSATSAAATTATTSNLPDEELRLDDAFGVHYNMEQCYTHGDPHYDPSDITINICLEKDRATRGSHVLFHGTKKLYNITRDDQWNERDATTTTTTTTAAATTESLLSSSSSSSSPKTLFSFFVEQIPGTATIHYGDHLHETTKLWQGHRTNIILTFWYKQRPSNVATRTCYDNHTHQRP